VLKSVIRDAIVYGLSSIIAGIARIALIPVYTYVFSPEEYGSIALISSTSIILSLVMGCSTETAYTRYFHEIHDQNLLLQNILAFRLVFGIFTYIIYVICCFIMINTQIINIDMITLAIVGFTAYFNNITEMFVLVMRMKQKPWLYFLHSTFSSAISALSSVVIIHFDTTVQGYVIGQIVGILAGLFISFIIIRPSLAVFRIQTHKIVLKQLLSFSIPLFPASVSQYFNTNIDKWSIATLISNIQVGVYEYGNNIASMFSLVNSVIRTAFLPYSMKIIQYPRNQASILLKQLCNIYVYIITLLWAIFGEISIIIANIMAPPQFHDAIVIIRVIALSGVIYNLTIFSTLGSWRSNHSSDYTFAILAGVIANICISLTLIPIYGIIGASFANLLANIITVAFSFFLSEKRYSFRFNYKYIGLQIILSICYLFVALYENSFIYCGVFGVLSTMLFFITSFIDNRKYREDPAYSN
jgi:O-antigen/teichoic acid export membrane protein